MLKNGNDYKYILNYSLQTGIIVTDNIILRDGDFKCLTNSR
jgi:hypothetical protein